MTSPTTIFAKQALLPTGWRENVSVTIDADGHISNVTADTTASGSAQNNVDVLLPGIGNVHSHSFQRAMAGLAEVRGPGEYDDFWTWRKVMYRFLEILTPDDIEAIAAMVQMEMLEAGYTAQAEFHYLHHAPGGQHYANLDELSTRHFEAAKDTGIGYTHLPVLYMRGGLDDRPLAGGQLRFGCSLDSFQELFAANQSDLANYNSDSVLGVAPHSMRAVTQDGLNLCTELAPNGPIHIHAAEQTGEVEEVVQALGARPVRWLLDEMPIDKRWCFIHATQLDDAEVIDLANSGAVAGLCPITEANLGDGIFRATEFLKAGGAIGFGSDSDVIISLAEELRQLETSQRLRDRRRTILTTSETPSNGRYLYEKASAGGAQALGRKSGELVVGALGDCVSLNGNHQALIGLSHDTLLDSWIFSGADDVVKDVWSAGRHVVQNGRHSKRESITATFANTVETLRKSL